jgi:putative phosphoesterase
MRIGVISDTHGDTRGWRAAVEGPFAGAGLILHAGDLLYHGPRNPLTAAYAPPELAELINHAPAPVVIARGNCDSEVDQLVLDFPVQAPYALIVIEGLRIMVTHGTEFGLEDPVPGMRALAERYRLDVLVSGHTHVALLERAGGALLMNPGSPSLPKSHAGQPVRQTQGKPRPTVGIIEDDIARIVTLEGRVLMESPLARRQGR